MARLVCVVFLLLLLGLTALFRTPKDALQFGALFIRSTLGDALTDSVPDVFVKEEHDVVLDCDRVQDGQPLCNTTMWIYRNRKMTVEMVTLGELSPGFRYKDRCSVTEACSLVIRSVQLQDQGHYTCQLYGQSEKEDATLVLSVVSLTEHTDVREEKLNCYVFSSHSCSSVLVKLLYNGTQVKTDHPSSHVRSYPCGTSVTFHPAYYSTLRRELLSCEVTHKEKKYLFRLREEPSDPERPRTNEIELNINSTGRPSSAVSGWWWAGPVAVALTVSALVLVKWRKKKAKPHVAAVLQPPTLTPETEADADVSYASIVHSSRNKSKAKPRQTDEETVTYCSVKTPVSHDVNPLYASVRKH